MTPERALYEGPASIVVVPGYDDGEVAFLPAHAPYVGILGYGVLRIELPDGRPALRFGVYGGFVQVIENEVRVLARKADLPEDATPARLQSDESALATLPVGTDAEYAGKTLARREAGARKRLAGSSAQETRSAAH